MQQAVRAVKAAVSKTGLSPCGIQRTLRAGLVGIKMGMTAAWDLHGRRHALTIIKIERNHVVQVKCPDVEGYNALQIGAVDCSPKNVTKPLLIHFQKAGVSPKRVLKEFPVTPDAVLSPGTEIGVTHFVAGQYIDVTGISIGKGFQGAMKRHGFSGGPASHGASLSHRSLGSTGHRKTPSKTWKGKKMHGHMGNNRVTTLSLLVYCIDPVNQLLCVKGAVPGHDQGYLYLRDAVRLKQHTHNQTLKLPVPTAPPPTSPEDLAVTTAPASVFTNPYAVAD